MTSFENNPIILFDGLCNLCNYTVKFVLKHDKKQHFLFASLQSDAAKKHLLHYNYKNNDLSSILLIDGDKIKRKSAAVLIIFKYLGLPWKILSVFSFIPISWRDGLYDLIANNRYKLFGKRQSCLMMVPEYKNRFIQ